MGLYDLTTLMLPGLLLQLTINFLEPSNSYSYLTIDPLLLLLFPLSLSSSSSLTNLCDLVTTEGNGCYL